MSTAVVHTKVITDLDLDRDGKQFATLQLPHSTNTSGWGSLLIPIVVVRRGEGPTVLLTGGNHGDEYEGPIALLQLAARLDAEQLRGRVIIMPGLNYPALMAGTRLSPIDGRNMNRVFPGRYDGTVTEVIAHYVQHFLLPWADVVVDIHSGGNSMIFEPAVVMHFLGDAARERRTLAALKAFGAPVALVLRELDGAGMLDSAAEDLGKIFISTELGGGGLVTPQTLETTERGLDNLLIHFGLVQGDVVSRESLGLPATRIMETPASGAFYVAERAGLYEVLHEVGDELESGELLGRILNPEHPDEAPFDVLTARAGRLVTRAGRGWVKRGDTIAVIATELAAGAIG